ncbi:MAG: ATP-binding protein, partial [Anaerolineales bacterium]
QFNILSGNQQGLDYIDVLQPDFERISISRLGEKTIQELVELSFEPLPIEVRKEIDSQEIFEVQLRKAQTIEGQYWILMIADVTEERGIMNRIRIQDRLATLGQFAAGITHDFNNILSAIMVYSDVLLRDSQLSENNRIRIDAIKEQSNRATDLISQILDFSRVQSVEQKPFDLIPFLEEIRELLTQILPDDIQIQVGINSSNENLPILGDPARIQQMIMNLALNSRDAMPEGGIIEILVELVDISEVDRLRYPGMDPGSWILLQVTDTGIGISQQDQSQMFEPFFTTKFDQGGTGLGLAQVYGIVKQHQGFIEVESSLGIGTTFNVFLPLFEGEIEDPPEPQLDVELDGGGDFLLIVEDDESLQKALGNLFEEHGFQVIQTANGKQAFDIIKQIGDKISLVITDVVMPKLGGVELYWKTQKIFPEKKFIFITGHPSKIANKAIGQESYTRVLQKPFSMIDILSLTREIRDTDLSDSKGQMMMI